MIKSIQVSTTDVELIFDILSGICLIRCSCGVSALATWLSYDRHHINTFTIGGKISERGKSGSQLSPSDLTFGKG